MKLSSKHHETILRAARTHEYEICGLVSANPDGTSAEVYECDNVAAKPSQMYEIDTGTQFKHFRDMGLKGTKLAAIYHSHPRSFPMPSAMDVQRAFYPDVVYLIAGLDADYETYVLRGYRITDGVVTREPININ